MILIPKHIESRLRTLVVYRAFRPCIDLFVNSGLVTFSVLMKYLETIIASGSASNLRYAVDKFVSGQGGSLPLVDRDMKRAIRMAKLDLIGSGEVTLNVCPDNEVLERLNKRASSGFPTFKKKGDMLYDFEKQLRVNRIEHFIRLPIVIFTRVAVASLEALKLRLVYGYPGSLTCFEQRYFAPLLDYFMCQGDSSYVIGKTQKDISTLMHRNRRYHSLSLDYSSFDLAVPPCLIYEAFQIIRDMFSASDVRRYHFDSICKYFIKQENFHPFCGMVTRRRGLPSGSSFTNVVGGFVNLFMIYYLLLKTGQLRFVAKIYVHGDDCLVFSTKQLDIRKFPKLMKRYDFTMNMSKTSYASVNGEREFLGSTWIDCKPYRDIDLLIIKCCLVRGKPVILDSLDDYVKSRVFTHFGYTADLPHYWKRLGFGDIVGQKVFLLNEGLSWETQLYNKRTLGTSQGCWITVRENEWKFR